MAPSIHYLLIMVNIYCFHQSVAVDRNTALYTLDECLEQFAARGRIPPLGTHALTTIESPDINEANPLRDKETDILNSQIVLASMCLLQEQMLSTDVSDSTNGPGLFGLREMDLRNSDMLNCILSARPPCRWEEILVTVTPGTTEPTTWEIASCNMEGSEKQRRIKVILDIAHNPPAIKSLMDKVSYHCKDVNVRSVFKYS